ncbi:MAG: class I SAM-dependent methyltransferase [Bacteroidota bacterium]
MNIHRNPLADYCESHSTPQSDLLYQLERESNLKTLSPQMISGPLQGQLLRLLSLMFQPQQVLEIGTFTAYATLCLAAGIPKGGALHTIEGNAELEYLIRKYIDKAKLNDTIHLHIGDAKTIVPTLDLQFDLAFIDAGKNDYALYYDLIFDKIKAGGIILADNVLWSGKVVQKGNDADTRVIDTFNKKVQADERVENLILPIRDGLSIIRKKV